MSKIIAQWMSSEAQVAGRILEADGSGAVQWVNAPSGGGGLPCGYVCGGHLDWTSVSAITIGTTSEDSLARDYADSYNIEWNGTLAAAITSSGAGSLDTGSEAASTWYAVHVIADSTEVETPKAMLSLSATAPTMPSGYDVFRRLGWVRNNSSSNFLRFDQNGACGERFYHYDEDRSDMKALTAGTAQSWTDIDLSSFIPPTSRVTYVSWTFDATNINAGCALAPKGSKQATLDVADSMWFIDPVLDTDPVLLSGLGDWINTNVNRKIQYRLEGSSTPRFWVMIRGFLDEI